MALKKGAVPKVFLNGCEPFKHKLLQKSPIKKGLSNTFKTAPYKLCIQNYRFPLNACSRSIASKSALKLPFPNDFAPFR